MAIKFSTAALLASTVVITATQLGATVGPVERQDYGNSAAFTINTTVVGAPYAPQGNSFSISDISGFGTTEVDALEVFWDYGDDYNFRYVTNANANDAAAGNSRGHLGAHVFPSAGTYTVGCLVYNRAGTVGTRTISVTVADADATYAGTLTKVVSADGVFTGKPAGAEEIDWSVTVDTTGLLEAGHRILFKAGMDVTMPNGLSTPDLRGTSTQIGKWGAGANPILRFDAGVGVAMNVANRSDKLTIYEVDFVGSYDPAAANDWFNEGSAPARPGEGLQAGLSQGSTEAQTVCLFGGSFTNFEINLNLGGVYPFLGIDLDISKWWNFGSFIASVADATKHLVGVKAVQPSNSIISRQFTLAQRGNWNYTLETVDQPNAAVHGPVRYGSAAGDCLVNKCEFESHTGWSVSNSTDDKAAIQPALRMGTTMEASGVENVCITQNNFHFGFHVVSAIGTTASAQGKPVAFVFDANYLKMNERSQGVLRMGKPGTVFRNNITEYPTGTTHIEGTALSFININGGVFEGDLGVFPCRVENNTLVFDNAISGVWSNITTVAGATITYTNNIYEMNGSYNVAGSSTPFGTADTRDWTPLSAAFLPQSGSAAFEAAAGDVPRFDYNGVERITSPSKGAQEPA